MSEQTLHRGRVRLVYEIAGEGPAVMLVQGLGLSGRMWLALAGGLVRTGHRVVVPDNRGTGRSDAPLPPYRMGELADDLAAVLEHARVGPTLVVGISLGGMVVQHLALRHPRLVAGLVLAATSCGPPFGTLPRLDAVPTMLRAWAHDARAIDAIHAQLVHPATLQRRPDLFAAWDRQAGAERTRWSGILGQLGAAALHSTGFALPRIHCPVEVITGDSDRIVRPLNSRIIAGRIPGAVLTVVPRAGHAFPLEEPSVLPLAIRRVRDRVSAVSQMLT
jgi:3-oxoadipate enol-lactonase